MVPPVRFDPGAACAAHVHLLEIQDLDLLRVGVPGAGGVHGAQQTAATRKSAKYCRSQVLVETRLAELLVAFKMIMASF